MLRATDRGARFLPVYVRRCAVLFAFGFLHYLIYPGDILDPYAILGFGLLFFQHWSPRWILVLVALLFLIHPVADSVWTEDQNTPPARPVNPIARIYLLAPDPQYRANIQRAADVSEHVGVRAQRGFDIWRARARIPVASSRSAEPLARQRIMASLLRDVPAGPVRWEASRLP